MAHKMVRQPSETPNINNIDDIVPFRYAYGNQDGYVIDKGNELSYTVNGNVFRINSGRVVLQGVEDDIDANGVSFTIDNIGTTRYFVIYYRVNLGTNTTSYEITYDTAGYPTIDTGDDLTKNSSGIANLPLYRFIASNGVISNVEKVVKAIEYSGTALVGYDIDKGTVENRLLDVNERLSRLGFKEGSITDSNNISVGTVKRQGNYVIAHINKSYQSFSGSESLTITSDFYPKQTTTSNHKIFIDLPSQEAQGIQVFFDFTTNKLNVFFRSNIWVDIDVQIGYEANPIE